MTSNATSESNFFPEREEAFHLIGILSSSSSSSFPSCTSSSSTTSIGITSSSTVPSPSSIGADAALSKFRSILDKYLECPTLLDPTLEIMVRGLSYPARGIVRDIYLHYRSSIDRDDHDEVDDAVVDDDEPRAPDDVIDDGRAAGETRIDDGNGEFGEIGISEKLLVLMRLLSAICAVCKVRGRKRVQRLMPHEAADMEPALLALRWFGYLEVSLCGRGGGTASSSSSGGGWGVVISSTIVPRSIVRFRDEIRATGECAAARVWESVHSLLTWLGIICLVPFDLCTIDSSLGVRRPGTTAHDGTSRPSPVTVATLVRSILTTSASHLGDYGATREAAASCLASLLSRPDLETTELEGFVAWSGQIVRQFRTGSEIRAASTDASSSSSSPSSSSSSPSSSPSSMLLPMPTGSPSAFLVMGVLRTLAGIFETGHRCNLLSDKGKLSVIENLWEECILMSEKGGPAEGSIMLRKLLVKLFARVGCAHLPPRIATWRYQRGRRSLVDNLRGAVSSSSSSSSSKEDDPDAIRSIPSCDLFHIPDQVEDAMDQLLRSLTDPATIVRWSAAKGIGRLTERLPAVCADDVLDAILQVCSDPQRDRAWHGACLALAELARRGLLLPTRLDEVIPVVVSAIGYDVRRGQHSVGSHVRDASCYVCWAFARAYAPSVLMPHVEKLSVALVLASLFDREINCRRAASAAFQESVGRQGADNFKHGIEILTTADYYSLGNRCDSFLVLAPDIAKFEEYQTPIMRHLADVKLLHWDVDIRSLASKSLSRISKLNPRYVAMDVLPKLLHQCFHDDIVVRHGSLLGVAETLLSFGELRLIKQGEVLNSETLDLIIELVPSIEKARLYRGRGGEMMRCDF
ncbi:hypothetical protein ACHAXA_008849 [Cyclostephanos tholiformis]|uniref:Tubulin-folding cofactor D ARM repeats domain-containing protein n=1 Tax=Cyclostephanos tholiformis TaxID=382380 RepID=A0ABD3SFN7_9STRA